MKKIVIPFLLAFFIVPNLVWADGGMIYFDPYSDRWDYADETNQQAFINYEDGVEKMILSVGVGGSKEGKTMWIFPVPADPQKVAVDVVTKLPVLRGEELSEKAQSNLDDAKSWLQATQVYTIPFAFLFRNTLSASSMPQSTGSFSNSLGGDSKSAMRPDVVVYEHLEKEGITSEIVTARTAQGFNKYFSKKGLKIDENSIPVLQNYIGKEYSFVVSWINTSSPTPIDSVKNAPSVLPHAVEYDYGTRKSDINQKGVFVSFATDKIFFPLMPTSVYGSKVVPAEIRIMGHITPDVFTDIKSYTKTGYYYDEGIQIDNELKSFYNGSNIGVKYTKIEINAPSKFFTEDLWVKNSAPFKALYQLFLARQVLLVAFFLIIICSVLAGVIVGWLLFREWRGWEGMKKFGLIGLANCLSILGMIALILPSNTKKDPKDTTSLIQTLKERGYYWRRRISLGVMIVDFPFLVISLLMLFTVLPQELPHEYLYNKSIFETLFSPIILLTFIPIIVFLIAILFAGRKRKEDEYLFDELKSKNYSSWTFQPKDKRKIWFIVFYSVVFLIISWAVVKLLLFSVGGN